MIQKVCRYTIELRATERFRPVGVIMESFSKGLVRRRKKIAAMAHRRYRRKDCHCHRLLLLWSCPSGTRSEHQQCHFGRSQHVQGRRSQKYSCSRQYCQIANSDANSRLLTANWCTSTWMTTIVLDLSPLPSKSDVPALNLLMLNAGIACLKQGYRPSGHERIIQVNFLSNALLICALLQTASHITWVSSRRHR